MTAEDERAIENYERRMERENEPVAVEKEPKVLHCELCPHVIDPRRERWYVIGETLICEGCVDEGCENEEELYKHYGIKVEL